MDRMMADFLASPEKAHVPRWKLYALIAIAAIGLLCGAVALVVSKQSLPDAEIVRRAVRVMKSKLESLPADAPIVERYGRFVSIVDEAPEYVRHAGGRDYGGDPPSIGFDLKCRFENYPASIAVGVYPKNKDGTVTFSISMSPNWNAWGTIGTERTEFDGVYVWVNVTDRPDHGNDIRMKSELTCIMSDALFRPK